MVKEKVIRNIGHIFYHSDLLDGTGMRITNELLRNLVEDYVKNTGKHMLNTGEAPFVYRERQLHSSLIPALFKHTDAVLSEAPIDRKWSSIADEDYIDSHGWVDYWCFYRNISFWIELKHSFMASATGKIKKKAMKEWNDAITQLEVIEEDSSQQSKWCKGSIRIALMVLPLYETVNKGEPKNVGDRGRIKEILLDTIEQFEDKPNWSAIWTIHESLAGSYEYVNTIEYYPGVIVLAKVYDFIK